MLGDEGGVELSRDWFVWPSQIKKREKEPLDIGVLKSQIIVS